LRARNQGRKRKWKTIEEDGIRGFKLSFAEENGRD
jgi:hypothetical protein